MGNNASKSLMTDNNKIPIDNTNLDILDDSQFLGFSSLTTLWEQNQIIVRRLTLDFAG